MAQYVCGGESSAHSVVIHAFANAASHGAGEVQLRPVQSKWSPVTTIIQDPVPIGVVPPDILHFLSLRLLFLVLKSVGFFCFL